MLYITLRGHCCDTIILNVPPPTEEKSDGTKYGLYKKLECVFDQFPKYHVKILLGGSSPKVGREDILKPTIANENLHEISNDNRVRAVNTAILKNLSRIQCSHIATFINTLGFLMQKWSDHILID
jgi:hypothetical protein